MQAVRPNPALAHTQRPILPNIFSDMRRKPLRPNIPIRSGAAPVAATPILANKARPAVIPMPLPPLRRDAKEAKASVKAPAAAPKPKSKALKTVSEVFGNRAVLFDPALPKITIYDTRNMTGQYITYAYDKIEELYNSNVVRNAQGFHGVWTNVTPAGQSAHYVQYECRVPLQIMEGTIPSSVSCPDALLIIRVLFANEAMNWQEPNDGVTVVIPKYGVKVWSELVGWCDQTAGASTSHRIHVLWTSDGRSTNFSTTTSTDTSISTTIIDQQTISAKSGVLRFLKHAMVDNNNTSVTLDITTAIDKKSGDVYISSPDALSTVVYDPLIELADVNPIDVIFGDSGLPGWAIALIVIGCVIVTAILILWVVGRYKGSGFSYWWSSKTKTSTEIGPGGERVLVARTPVEGQRGLNARMLPNTLYVMSPSTLQNGQRQVNANANATPITTHHLSFTRAPLPHH